jgi:hypothetical protein
MLASKFKLARSSAAAKYLREGCCAPLVLAAIPMKVETCAAIRTVILAIFPEMPTIAGVVILRVAAGADMNAAWAHLDLGGGRRGECDDKGGDNE